MNWPLCWHSIVAVQSLSSVRLSVTPWTAALQLPCPSLSPRICSDSCPFSQWWHPTISTSVIPFSSCPQSFLASSGLSQRVSSLHQVAQVLELQHQSFQWIFGVYFLYDWLVWSSCYSRDSQESFPAPRFESLSSLALSFLYGATLTSIHEYMTIGKTIALTIWIFVGNVMSLLSNILSRFVITILPRSKCLLISWLQSLSALILEPKKMKYDIVFTFSPSICHEVIGLDAMIFVFWMLSFNPAFSLSSFTFIKRLLFTCFH